jgi:hypothetical protein
MTAPSRVVPEPRQTRGYCSRGCGAWITGWYVRTISTGSGGGADVVYNAHHVCRPEPRQRIPQQRR